MNEYVPGGPTGYGAHAAAIEEPEGKIDKDIVDIQT